MDTRRLTEIEERCEKASKRPWEMWVKHFSVHEGVRVNKPEIIYGDQVAECDPDNLQDFPTDKAAEHQATNNAQFIAHARQDLPDLLAYCKSLRAEAAELARALIRSGVGQHDMYECRLCGREGHNLVEGAYGSLKHKPECLLSRPTVVELLKKKD